MCCLRTPTATAFDMFEPVPEERLENLLGDPLAIFWELQEPDVLTDHLVRGVTVDPLRSLIPGLDHTIHIARGHGVVDPCEDLHLELELLPTFFDLLLRQLSIGDARVTSQHAQRHAGIILDHRAPRQKPPDAAIFVEHAVLDLEPG